MRSVFTRAAALGCVFIVTCLAQQRLTVDKLVQFITSSISQKNLDKDVAGFLVNVKMTEKLDPRIIEDLQGKGAGPKTVAALNHLAEVSATLSAPAPVAAAPKPKPIPPPSAEEQKKVLDEVREYALNYSKTLPDFICLEVTRRYLDRRYKPGTEGAWAISDRLAEKLTYYDQKEKYEPISRNETSLFGKSSDSFGGALSRNEFGTLMKEVFDPETRTEFHWERWGNLEKHLFYVYAYSVDQPHSKWTLDYQRQQQVTPGYHGEIFVEKGSNVIWRITVDPEPPISFPMQNIHEELDYRYTDISGQKFLLPQVGQVIMRADGVGSKNEIEFRGYRKYSADTSIIFDDADDKPGSQEPPKEQPQQ